jgi:tetratricopeptide (TPR) repeat protein
MLTNDGSKTQMALEFAYRRHAEHHCPVFWVHADNYEKFMQGYRRIANIAQLSPELQGDNLMTAVRSWLEIQSNWLLVLDNADDLRHFGLDHGQKGNDTLNNLFSFVPHGSHGAILWTTRDERAVGHLVGIKRGINVTKMAILEAEKLLASLSGADINAGNSKLVADILERLDRLPLAITQAAFYMRETSTSFEKYIMMLRKEKKRWMLLTESVPSRHRQDNVPNSVMQTWRITIDYLRHENPLAHRILHVVVYLNNQNIPFKLMTAAGRTKLGNAILESGGDKDDTNRHKSNNGDDDSDDEDAGVVKAVTRLKQFSFLQVRTGQKERRSYDVHKLVQEATRYAIQTDPKSEDPTVFPRIALQIMLEEFPSGQYGTWDQCESLLSHALTVSAWREVAGEKLKISRLLSQASIYLFLMGRSREAEEIVVEVLELRREVLGEKHPDTIGSMASLAATYYQQGRSREAEEINMEVLELRREVLGEKHPDTIRSMASLATTYHQQGRSREAEEIDVEVLELRREVLGEKHPDAH